MHVQENIFQQALRLLYERRLEQLGLTAAVTVTERKEREDGRQAAAHGITYAPHPDRCVLSDMKRVERCGTYGELEQ